MQVNLNSTLVLLLLLLLLLMRLMTLHMSTCERRIVGAGSHVNRQQTTVDEDEYEATIEIVLRKESAVLTLYSSAFQIAGAAYLKAQRAVVVLIRVWANSLRSDERSSLVGMYSRTA